MNLFDKTFKIIRTSVWIGLFPPTRVSFLLCRWPSDRRSMAEYHQQAMAEIIHNARMDEFTVGILYHYEPEPNNHHYLFVATNDSRIPERDFFGDYELTGVAILKTEDLEHLQRVVSSKDGACIVGYVVKLNSCFALEVPFSRAFKNEFTCYRKIYDLLKSTWLSIGLHTSSSE